MHLHSGYMCSFTVSFPCLCATAPWLPTGCLCRAAAGRDQGFGALAFWALGGPGGARENGGPDVPGHLRRGLCCRHTPARRPCSDLLLFLLLLRRASRARRCWGALPAGWGALPAGRAPGNVQRPRSIVNPLSLLMLLLLLRLSWLLRLCCLSCHHRCCCVIVRLSLPPDISS